MNMNRNASMIYRRTLLTALAVTVGTLATTALFTDLLSPSPNGSFLSLLTVAGFSCVAFSLAMFFGVDNLARHAIACEMQEVEKLHQAEDFMPSWMHQYAIR